MWEECRSRYEKLNRSLWTPNDASKKCLEVQSVL